LAALPWSFQCGLPGRPGKAASLLYPRDAIFILSGFRKVVKTGREGVGRKSACVRRRSKSPAHDKALYPSIASRDAIIRRSYAPLEEIQIVNLFRYPTSLVVALAGG